MWFDIRDDFGDRNFKPSPLFHGTGGLGLNIPVFKHSLLHYSSIT